ncbi:MAG: membrane dipeptidase [Xanthomonadales bacterium]|nr:membrane dipeptidase [Xanthomonadales bacterium]
MRTVDIFLLSAGICQLLLAANVFADKLTIEAQARQISGEYVIVDTHIDVPYRLEDGWVDVTVATDGGDFDYPRAMQGGLNLPFMSIYTPAELEKNNGDASESYQLANRLIDSVEALAARAPDKFMLVSSVADAEKAVQTGRIGLAMGMENGSPINHKLENIQFFADRGIRYITLAHGLSNHISDSSYDENHQWDGLSPFGKTVVAEMNRVGVMIDISHVSDDAFFQVMELTKTPVIASHSSPRHFTPGWERNMSDDMIKALAKNGGVIQINFGSSFLIERARVWYEAMDEKRKAYLEENELDEDSAEASQFQEDYRADNPFPYASMDDLVASFVHVIELVGAEHVGIGSDFDGVGDSLPENMKDVSFYPVLVEELLKREYPLDTIRGIMGGNLLRVWSEVEAYAAKQ